MPTQAKEYEVQLSEEQVEAIQQLADLRRQSFQETANDVINEVLEQELPRLLARGTR